MLWSGSGSEDKANGSVHAEKGTSADELSNELKRKAFRGEKLLPGVSFSTADGSGQPRSQHVFADHAAS